MRIDITTKTLLVALSVVLTPLPSVAQSPAAARAVTARVSEPEEVTTRLVESEGSARLEQRVGSRLIRVEDVSFEPSIVQSSPETHAVVAVGRIGTTSELEALVVPPAEPSWRPDGHLRRVLLAESGNTVLVQVGHGGGQWLDLYSVDGRRVARLDPGLEGWEDVALARDGQAVLVAPGGGDPGRSLRLYDVQRGNWEEQTLPAAEMIEEAVAIDRHRVISLGAGKLRLHSFRGNETGASGWSMRPDDGAYLSLRGATRHGGGLVLASRGNQSFDLVDLTGEVVWRLRLDEEAQQWGRRLELPAADAPEILRRLQPWLQADGTIELSDHRTGERYSVKPPNPRGG